MYLYSILYVLDLQLFFHRWVRTKVYIIYIGTKYLRLIRKTCSLDTYMTVELASYPQTILIPLNLAIGFMALGSGKQQQPLSARTLLQSFIIGWIQQSKSKTGIMLEWYENPQT